MPDCWIVYPRAEEFQWAPASTSAVVVATIVLSVNNATNITSTSTIYNTNYLDPLPGITNPAGTQVSTLTVSDPVAGTNWSTVVYVHSCPALINLTTCSSYPTPFVSYAYSWEVEGTYETTSADGATACITGDSKTYSPVLLPSHPAIPFTCEANATDPDPYGEFYRLTTVGLPDGNWSCTSPDFAGSVYSDWGTVLFPNVFPTGCTSVDVAPAMVLTVVKSLTDTSTRFFSSSTQAPEAVVSPLGPSSEVSAAAQTQSTTPSPPPPPSSEIALPSSSSDTPSAQAVLPSSTPSVQVPPPSNTPSVQAVPLKAESSNQASQASPTTSTTPLPQLSPSTSTQLAQPFASSRITVQPEANSQASAVESYVPTLTLSVGAAVITASPGSAIVVEGSTIVPGAAITVSNTVISLATGAPALFIGSSTIPLAVPIPAASQALPAVTINSQAITADSSSHYIIGSQTLAPGSAITVSNTVISLATGASALFIGSSTIPLAVPIPAVSQALPAITINSQAITADSSSHYIIGSQTLVPGSAITVSNTIISLATNAAAIVIGSSAIPLAAPASPTSVAAAPVITFNSQPITANSASDYIIGTQTLVPGSAITVSNTIISLATGASAIFIGSSSISLAAPAAKASAAPPVISFAGSTLTANAASEFVFSTQTLTPGGPAITVSGAKLSLASNAAFIVEDASTINLTPTATGAATIPSGIVGVAGGSVGTKGTNVVTGSSAGSTGLGGQIAQPFAGEAAVSRSGGVGLVACIVGLAVWAFSASGI
ncbi:MAG: hypothetical protein LQ347_001302 [Umbilicaria vellea]|nr:MAG: hypothetical protein LQ347_001302 [Umbilicaria vellea]